MLYLLDTSVLIDAKNKYYPIDRIPHFWGWLLLHSQAGNLKLPPQVIEEVLGRETPDDMPADDLAEWVALNRTALELPEELGRENLIRTYDLGYGTPLSNVPISGLISEPADPFLVAYALDSPRSRRVVTMENVQFAGTTLPKPANRRIPLVCRLLGVTCINTFDLIRELDFRIPLSANFRDTIAST